MSDIAARAWRLLFQAPWDDSTGSSGYQLVRANPALGRVLFREWFAEWQRTTARLRPNTEARDERLFRLQVLPTSARCRWLRSANGTCAPGWLGCYQLLSKVMAAAVDAGMIPQTPCRRVPPAQDRAEGDAVPLPAEVWKLADAIASEYRALILLGALGGSATTANGCSDLRVQVVGVTGLEPVTSSL